MRREQKNRNSSETSQERRYLEILLCPKIEKLKLFHETPICTLQVLSCPKRQTNKHCAKKS